ncbi:PREDICTED: uncharacterized protein LOC104799596 [Tarenaya hassleriana]|uniref:uncharacterized protein LOC104799596 n=1 Tax=Tarenaya hassleriana TaxID=28532 RepID=UPI00053C25C3|nr:PREDICTED: uncharacterized protein LOC104799596 [Tarenaya hassleriana]
MASSFGWWGRIGSMSALNMSRSRGESVGRVVSVKGETQKEPRKLGVGSPIVIVEAPKVIKTAASIPCLRPNSGLVNPGDVGRIVSRKPKDVWAVRLAVGTYLLDGKYFRALEELDGDRLEQTPL